MFFVNVEGAIRKNDKWLIIERSKKEKHAGGLFSLVGGTVEIEGNSSDILERTLKREIFEEVGVKVNKLQYVHNTSFSTEGCEHVINIVFLCSYESGDACVKSPDEVEDVMWLTAEEIYNHSKSPIYLKESIRNVESILDTGVI